MFSTIAIIFWHWIVILIVTLWTFPVVDNIILFLFILVYVKNPIFYAFKVHWNWTTCTSPDVILPSHIFGAYDAGILKMTLFAALLLFELWSFIFFFSISIFVVWLIILVFFLMSFYINIRIILQKLFFRNVFALIFLSLCILVNLIGFLLTNYNLLFWH